MTSVSMEKMLRASEAKEIDLVDLFQGLWADRRVIGGITLAVVLLALGYALLATPVYQARVGVLPPRSGDIAGYNLGRHEAGLEDLTVEDVYQAFTRNLSSESVRRQFFKDAYLPSLPESGKNSAQDSLWNNFNKALTVKALTVKASTVKAQDKAHPEYFEVSVEADDPQKAVDWANLYVNRADERTRKDMQGNVSAEIGMRINAIERQISVLSQSAVRRREDRIVQLQEALRVAKAMGQDKPLITSMMTTNVMIAAEDRTPPADDNLLYMRGTRAIEAEIEVLESRKTDAPFVSKIRDYQEQIEFLKEIEVKPGNVAVFTLDNPAVAEQTLIKPKRGVIIVLGVMLGAMLGMMVGMVRFTMSNRRA